MAKLTAKTRAKIPTSKFAGPNRSYPIEDASHARNALSRVSQFGSPALKSKVRAAVHKAYPGIGKPMTLGQAQKHRAKGKAFKETQKGGVRGWGVPDKWDSKG